MKFTCEKAVLSEAISICIHAVASRSTITVLEGLLITAADQLTICGYNFKTGIKKTFSADISEKGSIVLNAKSSTTSSANFPMTSSRFIATNTI